MSIPVMFGASLLKIIKAKMAFTAAGIIVLLVGMITAFAVSIVAIRYLMNYIRKHDFKVFGYYRIILGIIVLIFGAVGLLG
jgi:undecaprenyl-diphosphatase